MTGDVLAQVRDALARHRWQEAFDAAQAVHGASPGIEAERLDLLADAAWWLGHLEVCVEARERAYRGFEEQGASRRAGQCAVWLYEHHLFRTRPAMAGAWLRRARHQLGDDPECEEHGSLQLREAEAAHGSGRLEEARELATAVVQLGRRLHSANLEAEALQTLGRVLIEAGEVDEGLAHLDEAMLFAIEGRLGPYSTGKVYCSLISACEELGDLDRAAEWTDATSRWSERHPLAIFPGICRVHHAVILGRQGALAEAEAEATRAGEELIGSHLPNAAAAFTEVGDIRRRLGDLEGAEEAFARASAITGQSCGGVALLRLAQGKLDAALRTITDCMQHCGSSRLARARLLPMVVQITAAAGDLDAATDALAELETIAETYGSPFLRATVLSTKGRLQIATGDGDAVTTLRTAVVAWQELEVPYELATAHTLLGAAQRAVGDEAATNSFATAAALFDQIGARLAGDAMLGDAPKQVLPAGLTEREAEVLRLIASGMTNKAVADALFLSAKTVSRHLSNIFTKIGVSSRAGATAFAFEHGLITR